MPVVLSKVQKHGEALGFIFLPEEQPLYIFPLLLLQLTWRWTFPFVSHYSQKSFPCFHSHFFEVWLGLTETWITNNFSPGFSYHKPLSTFLKLFSLPFVLKKTALCSCNGHTSDFHLLHTVVISCWSHTSSVPFSIPLEKAVVKQDKYLHCCFQD